jgi:hypothetical protein
MTDPKRADPFDLSDFQPTPPKKPATVVHKEAIRQVSEDNNFPSRAAERAKPVGSKPVVQQRRRRTGRNVQFNIKATAETIARFTALADRKGIPFGELLDQLLDTADKPPAKS